MGDTMRGSVKWFNDAKGYGFIESEKGDVFVHYSVIDASGFKTLKDGEEVEYELDAGEKGLHAKRVTRVNAPIAASQESDNASIPTRPLASQIEVERMPQAAEQDQPASSTILEENNPAIVK